MVTTVVNNMDFAIENASNVRINKTNKANKANGKANSDSDFEKILNQEANQSSDKMVSEKDVEKPTTNIKNDNGNKHKIKSSENEKKINDTEDITEENLSELEDKIADEVVKALNITREQLDEMLTQLNMTVFDLLSSDKLNTFLMALYEVDDSLELLTMPNATSDIKELKTGLNELTESYNLETDNIESIENIKKLIADAKTENDVNGLNNQLKDSDEAKELSNKKEEVSNDNKELPKIDIRDDRTDKSSLTENESNLEVVSNDSKGAFDNVQNITINQTEIKVEIVDESGQKQILTYNVSTEEVIDQIVSSFKVNLTDDADTVYIQLKPEHLGKLALSLTQQEGVVTANFVAENGAVKELIETNLASLRMALQEQGMVVDKLEVVVNDNNMFNNNNDSSKQSSHNNDKKRRAAKMMKISSIEEEINNEISEDENVLLQSEDISSIDYSV